MSASYSKIWFHTVCLSSTQLNQWKIVNQSTKIVFLEQPGESSAPIANQFGVSLWLSRSITQKSNKYGKQNSRIILKVQLNKYTIIKGIKIFHLWAIASSNLTCFIALQWQHSCLNNMCCLTMYWFLLRFSYLKDPPFNGVLYKVSHNVLVHTFVSLSFSTVLTYFPPMSRIHGP